MKSNFQFNTEKYNFWELYNTINKYYPIGVDRGWGRGIYFKYPGIQELENIVVENIHIKENFENRWESFAKPMGKKLNRMIMGMTYGQAPSFSSSVVFNDQKSQNISLQKKLHFSVSLIGKFYQIYGFDESFQSEIDENGSLVKCHRVTTSPLEEFEESFEIIEKMINDKFPGYRIVPYSIGQSIIKGLQVRYLDDEDCTINKALFNQFLSTERASLITRGNINYGIECWKINND